ncbi:MAG: CU044_5270 family protein [Nocardioidaceae bacterium]
MTEKDYVEQMLIDLNPVPSTDTIALDPRAEADLHRILDSPQSPRVPVSRRRTQLVRRPSARIGLIVASAVLAAIGLHVVEGGGGAAMAMTPPVLPTAHQPTTEDAAAQLRQIAELVAAQPDDTGSGDAAIIEMQSWSLFTRIDGEQVTSEVVPEVTTKRVEADGSAEYTSSYTFADGSTNVETASVTNALSWPLRGLSADPATLAAQLSAGHTQQGAAGRFDAVVDAYRQMPIGPPARAAILRYLAGTDGIASVGSVTDRIGREGLGFTLNSDYSGLPTRYMVVISPTTGELLDYEETLTGDAGKLNVQTPAVVNYIVWKDARYVD